MARKSAPTVSASSINAKKPTKEPKMVVEDQETAHSDTQDGDSYHGGEGLQASSELEIKGASLDKQNHEDTENAEADGIESIRYRVDELVRILSNFKVEREEGHSRKEYLELLLGDLQNLYGYNEFLITKFLEILPVSEVMQLLDANESTRPLTLRVNTLKIKRRDLANLLIARGVHLQVMEKWNSVGLQVFESKVSVGATLEYLAGYYMVQSAVSFLPVIALDAQKDEKILDMAAAPGGKSSHICQSMDNTGIVFANDFSSDRCKALYANLQRLGCYQTIITSIDGRKYSKMYPSFFDRVLLDAPCCGSGIVSRDKSVKLSKNQDDIDLCVRVQKQLLLSAIDSCKIGGTIVYSTCSILVDENECVIEYALKKRGIKIVESGLPFGRPGFHKFRQYRMSRDLSMARRFYPHLHNLDGFFVCKLEKVSDYVHRNRAQEEGAPTPLKKKKSTKRTRVHAERR